jgi:hypothetical protein
MIVANRGKIPEICEMIAGRKKVLLVGGGNCRLGEYAGICPLPPLRQKPVQRPAQRIARRQVRGG